MLLNNGNLCCCSQFDVGLCDPVVGSELCCWPEPVVEFISPAPAPVVEYIAATPAFHKAPGPVAKYISPAPAVSCIAPSPVVYATPAPVVEYTGCHVELGAFRRQQRYQRIQPKPKTQLSRTGRPVGGQESTKEIEKPCLITRTSSTQQERRDPYVGPSPHKVAC